ncbi:hypothetical protein [Roseibaca sp. Y0-43]|jgi:hypothetical protein|uniref:hypothetical protein n=1 Tax=Roseibaca sp. Y0-43 TaxID=2816854 RepID=UPI001D0CD39A|nr:hypothetical protein [Roseibaca sp. Y0-43]MCC1482781.1 hypothetical protein [Roseibaca sp. Y0-43]
MANIEPNITAAFIFALFACVTSLAAIVLTGVFPLSTRPELKRPLGFALVAANCVLLIAVVYLTLGFGLAELRWTSVVIITGFALLFMPGLFNVWPSRWRDGALGLTIVTASLGGSAWALAGMA